MVVPPSSGKTSALMDIRLLGPVEVWRCGARIESLGPRQLSLLLALLAHANEVVPAERLILDLWGETPPPTVATALQVHVSRLRKAFEGEDCIVTRRPGYLIKVGADQVDALRFERLVAQGRAALRAGEAERAASLLAEGLALWRGPALGEFADRDFARPWATHLQLLRLAALEDRIEADLRLGRHAAVVDELTALVAAEPLRERFWAQLMLALYRSGRQAEALRAFQDVSRLLAEELGIEPRPELRQLESDILLQRPELDWAATATAIPPPAPTPAGQLPADPQSLLVGRAAELDLLGDLVAKAMDGHGSLVLVRGEPGIGKTRLAEEVAEGAAARGARVLWGRCYEDAGGGPYGPWTEALRVWPDAVSLAGGTGTGAAEPDPDSARHRLFQAVTTFLREQSRQVPLVLVIDDLQWADRPSLLLLQWVSRQLPSMPVVVIGTYRTVDMGRDHPLKAALGELARHPATQRVALGGLTPADVGRLIEVRTGLPAAGLAEAVHRRTEGNPFFVREVLRLLQAEGRLSDAGAAEDTGIPEGVREVVGRRCARLSNDAHRLLGMAAAAGWDFAVDVVEAVWDGPDPVLDLLEEAEAAGLVTVAGMDTGHYRFSHDIVRETLYEEVSPLRRARLHGRIGAALAAKAGHGADVPPASVAHHLLLGVPGRSDADRAGAARWAVRAAEAATACLAYEEAVDWYEQGLAALPAVGSERDRVEVLLGLGEARWRAGDVPAARQTFLDAAELALALPDYELLADAVLGFGGGALRGWHATRGLFGDEPVRLIDQALQGIGRGDSAPRARLLGLLAEELYYQPESERKDALSAEAVAMARRLDDCLTLASTLSSRCLALWGPDHLDERRAIAGEIVDLARRLEDRQLLFFGLQYVLVAQIELGDMASAEETLNQIEQVADALRQPLAQWEVRRYRAMQALFAGELYDAERLALEALAIGQEAQEPDAMAVFGTQVAVIRFEQRRLAEVEPALREFVEEFSESPAWRAALGVLVAELGHADEARSELDALARDGFRGIPRDFAWLAAMALLAQLASFSADADRAALLYDLLLPFADRHAITADRQSWGAAARYLGLLAWAKGDADEAAAWFERAVEDNRRMGTPVWTAYAQLELADVLRRGRDDSAASHRDRARALAADALEVARRLGLTRLQQAAEQLVAGFDHPDADPRLMTMRPFAWTPALSH
jgi:DNA-binding SARP family transcriptional activator